VRSDPASGHEGTHLVEVLGVSAPVSAFGPPDRRIATIAAAQRGRIARGQLLSAGISNSAIRRRIVRGLLHPEHPGVYAVGHAAPQPWSRETTALLSCGMAAVLSHRSAAELWELIPADGPDRRVEVTVAGRQTGRPPGVIVHRSAILTGRDVALRHGLPVTSPARTLLDEAEILADRELERALDEAIIQKLVDRAAIDDVLSRAAGRHGAPALAGVLERYGEPARTRSEAERRFLALVKAAKLPIPLVNHPIRGYTIDFMWPRQRLAVEIDGYRYHSARGAFERDRAKGANLAAAGLCVVRFTWLQLVSEPHVVIARTAQALAWQESRSAAG
jgi:very-short-patch-repair endonuclease